MNENEFWDIVERVKGLDGDEAHARRLSKALRNESADRIRAFAGHFYRLEERANQPALWIAATLVNGGACSDDCFQYFRRWLISRGRAAYSAALGDPDSMISEVAGTAKPIVQFESFGYAAVEAYKAVSRRDLYSDLVAGTHLQGAQQGSREWASVDESVLAKQFPQLWGRFGPQWREYRSVISAAITHAETDGSAVIDGVGPVRVGSLIRHPRFGVGRVVAIAPGNPPLGRIEFPDGTKGIALTKEFAQLVSE